MGNKGRLIKLYLVIVLTLNSSLLRASQINDKVEIEASVDKAQITIGEEIDYRLKIVYPKGIKIDPSTLGENLTEFEIKDYKLGEEKEEKEGRYSFQVDYYITLFSTGDYTIPEAIVKFKDKTGKIKEARSSKIDIKVVSVIKKDTPQDDIRPIKGPIDVKKRNYNFLLLLPLFILIIYLYLRYRKKRVGVSEEISEPPRAPEEIAREKLERLKEREFLEHGRIKEHYLELSEVIREYIEARFHIYALERTSYEITREMKKAKIDYATIRQFEEFLSSCDLVKFAKYTPDAQFNRQMWDKAWKLIE